MDAWALEHHLTSPQGKGHVPEHGVTVSVGGGSCCDTISISLSVSGGVVSDAGFEAAGCGTASAAGSAAVSLVRGAGLLAAAKVGPGQIAAELGGLSPGKLHAAELAADALARALGNAAFSQGALERPAGGRVLVAMSGGVDSSVAALMCAEASETVAVTLELWADTESDSERSCCSATAVAQARALAHGLGLPHFSLDLRQRFRTGVVEPFIAGYRAGDTPNPCVGCNGEVRLDAMLELADRLGCDVLATGHYARLAEMGEPAGPLLRVGADPAKDQSYMLAALAAGSLGRMRFPLGELTKPEVRSRALAAGLPVARKADSQDLCFLAGTNRSRFLARHGGLGDRPGEIVDVSGRVLGRHRGQHNFTVGQRRGLGMAGGTPLYVLQKNAAASTVTVGFWEELAARRVWLRNVTLRRDSERVGSVKLRYRTPAVGARLSQRLKPGRHEKLELELDQPFHAVAPGQLACLMDGELLVGTGTISRGP